MIERRPRTEAFKASIPSLVAGGLLQFVEEYVEALEVALPGLAVTLDHGVCRGERLDGEPPRSPRAFAPDGYQAGPLEQLQVLGDSRLTHGERSSELVNRGLALG